MKTEDIEKIIEILKEERVLIRKTHLEHNIRKSCVNVIDNLIEKVKELKYKNE